MSSSFQIQLDGTTLDPAVARRALIRLIGDTSTIEFVRDAVLLTSELVTNAVVHAGGKSMLRAGLVGGNLRVELSDANGMVPELNEVDPARVGGRGLHLVDDVASRWGITSRPRGKTIWFELDCLRGEGTASTASSGPLDRQAR
jgi:anti-sigma regulatory factor (Ser/Thr protein kinase)